MVTPTWVRTPPAGPRLVHVNATATGGGVAELLHGLVAAQAEAGQRVGWAVIGGDAEFFAFTKGLHHLLHGRTGTRVTDAAVAHYRAVLRPQAHWLADRLGPGDVVVLHDPQTLGMAPPLAATGARVVWHCHIGTDQAGASGPALVWREFIPELSTVDAVVTTLAGFAPPVPEARRFVAAPAIDPRSPKNRELATDEVARWLDEIGLTDRTADNPLATVEQAEPMPRSARMVLQVSRWDPLKDMPGVLRCLPGLPGDVHLVLAGTNPEEIPDDPEGRAVLAEVRAARDELPAAVRRRVHLVRTSLRDAHRAALLINALQRRADVVVQKSLAEGFGLTVTEAMVKRRAVVAGNVGGLRQQIVSGDTGLLVDPADLPAVTAAVRGLLADPDRRRRLGARAAESAGRKFTMSRLVADYRAFATHEVGVYQ